MKNIIQIILVMSFVISTCFSQEEVKARRRSMVGVLYDSKIDVYKAVGEKFKLETIVIGNSVKDIPFIKGNMVTMARNIRASGCSHVFAVGIQSALAAFKSKVPGVFSMVMNPFSKGLIKENGMPSANLTGILMDVAPNLQIKQLREIVGELNQVGMVHRNSYPKFIIDAYIDAYKTSGFNFITKSVVNGSEVMLKFEELKGQVDFCVSLIDSVCYNKKTMPLISRFSLINKIPFIGCSRKQVKMGGLVGFFNNYDRLGEQAAVFVNDLLTKEENISNIPVVFSTSFDYSINIQTAKVMKLEFSDSMRLDASILYGE